MNVDSSGLTVMDFTPNYCRIGICFHFKTRYPVSMYVAALKITLKTQNMRFPVKVLFKMNAIPSPLNTILILKETVPELTISTHL